MGSSSPPPPPPPSIQLSTTVQTQPIAGIVLNWTGASGANVDFYQNGVLFKTVLNDGTHLNSKGVVAGSTYTYKVCQQGTNTCSNTVATTMQ